MWNNFPGHVLEAGILVQVFMTMPDTVLNSINFKVSYLFGKIVSSVGLYGLSLAVCYVMLCYIAVM